MSEGQDDLVQRALRSAALDELTAARRHYEAVARTMKEAQDRLTAAVVRALRHSDDVSEIVEASGFSATYVRRLARAAGLPARKGGPKPRSTGAGERR
jgi:hypothetical protein